MNFLSIGLPPDKMRLLEERADREGKTPEELAAELFDTILGLLIIAAIIGVAVLMSTSPYLSERVSRFVTPLEEVVESEPVATDGSQDVFWRE